MLPNLTAGSINRILDGEEVIGAVMQILGYKKIPGAVSDRYRLAISDSVDFCSCVMLGTQLNSLVTNKELEQFAVVRVDKYIFDQLQSDRKVIILLKLIVLTPGAEVGEKIGNPIPVNSTTSATPVRISSNATEATISSSMLPKLSAGSINRILEGEDVTGAVMQILGCMKIPDTVPDRYRLGISDSVAFCSYVMLGTHLNSLVTNKELEKFAVVRVDKCVFNQLQSDRKVLILLRLVVLTPGAAVGEKICNPIPVNSTTFVTPIRTWSNANEATISSSMLPNLTAGSINQILDGEEMTGAVMQILGCKQIPGAAFDRYRLLISDSVALCSCVMLGIQLNSLVTNKELEKFTVVRVDKCVCNQMQQPDRKVIILLSLTVLTPGAEVGKKIGNPIPAKTEGM